MATRSRVGKAVIVIGALAFTIACAERDGGGATVNGGSERDRDPQSSPGSVAIIADPAEVQAARDAAAERRGSASTLEALLAEAGWTSQSDLEPYRDVLVPQLVAIVAESADDRRTASAAVLLCLLGDTSHLGALAGLLASDRTGERLHALRLLGNLLPPFCDLDPSLLRDDQALMAALLATLGAADARLRRQAVVICSNLDVVAAADRIEAVIADCSGRELAEACFWLARLRPDMKTLGLVSAALSDVSTDREVPRLALAVETLVERGDQATREAACQEVERALEQGTWRHDRVAGDSLSPLVRAIVSCRGASAIPALRQVVVVVGTNQNGRDEAIRSLGALGDRASVPRLIELLGDQRSQRSAARSLGALLAGTADEQALEALEAAAAQPKVPPSSLAALAAAMIEIGGDQVKPRVAPLLDRLEPAAQASLQWKIEGITPETAVARLQALGIVGEVSLERAREEWGESASPLVLVYTALEQAGALTWFDTETGTIPARHDELIREFARHSSGVFRPEAMLEIWHRQGEDDLESPYTVQFVHEGRLYRFAAQNFGDWYDVVPVVTAINAALADAGRRQRFVGLHTGGQDAAFLLGDPAVIERAAKELHLALLDDAGQPREAGKAYERAVEERLRRSED